MSFFTTHSGHTGPVSWTPGVDSFTPSVFKPRVMAIILTIASCLIISTNLLVAAALAKILVKKRRQSWCFVLNLALADTLVGVAITGLATEDFNSNGNNYNATQTRTSNMATVQGRDRCLMRMAFVTSPCTASIMSMFLISLDRYAAIKMPLRYAQISGKGVVIGALAALWICAFTLGFMPVMVPSLQSERYNGFCAFFSVVYDVGVLILYSVCFFPVLSVFVYIYLNILKIACSHQRQIFQVRQAGSRTTEHGNTSDRHIRLRSPYWSHVKALRTVGMLVGCFLILWCPFFVVGIVKLLCDSCQLTQVLESYLWLLGLSNSLINPLVYAFWQREVRVTLAAMFSCFKGRTSAPQELGTAGSWHHQPTQNITRDAVNTNKSLS